MAASRRLLAQVVASQLIAEPKQQARIIRTVAAYLTEHKLADQPHMFINDLARELQRQTGHLSAEVVTAHPTDLALLQKLAKSLKSATGARTVDLQASHQPDLLGGFIVRTPDAMIDKTVRRQLSQLRNIA